MKIDEYERKKKHFDIQSSLNKIPLNSSVFVAANQEVLKNANKNNNNASSGINYALLNENRDNEKFNSANNNTRSKCLNCRSSSVSSYSSSVSSSYLPSQQSSNASSNLNCTELNCKNYFKRRDSSLSQVKSSFKINYDKPQATSTTTAQQPTQPSNSNIQLTNQLASSNNGSSFKKSVNKLRSLNAQNSMIDSPVLYTPSICNKSEALDTNPDTSIEESKETSENLRNSNNINSNQAQEKRCPKPIWNHDPLNLIKNSSNFIVHVSLSYTHFPEKA
jgi:hypothetical protein